MVFVEIISDYLQLLSFDNLHPDYLQLLSFRAFSSTSQILPDLF